MKNSRKRNLVSVLCFALAAVMLYAVFIVGCGNVESETPPVDTTPKEYTIQYTDEAGTHQLTVTSGMPYSLQQVPVKSGYDFTGLYDAEVGGTQYVSALGASLAPFTDGKNMVLFPQYKAKEYTLFLDYQGAAVTGGREYTVSYGQRLPELPKNVTLAHNEFTGWFTEAQNQGNQVADKYGLLAKTSYVNESNFDLSEKFIYLYAGFETEKHTVTFCYEAGMDTEEVQVAYNTPISQVVPETRVDGKAVLSWSKSRGGEVFNGKVTDDLVLYAVEYAPVIDLDVNGGKEVLPVIARAGSVIALPVPEKDLAKFSHWEDMQGNIFEETTMPESGITLKAVWQAKLVFDTNGGTAVDNISATPGSNITLPAPEKEGYIFAGWYTADKEQYTSTKMPAAGIALKAGWYKTKKEIVRIFSGTQLFDVAQTSLKLRDELTIDLSGFINEKFNGSLELEFHFQHSYNKGSLSNTVTTQLLFYSQPVISENVLLFSKTFKSNSTSNASEVFSQKIELIGNKIYCANLSSTENGRHELSDYYINISYPDTSNLIL